MLESSDERNSTEKVPPHSAAPVATAAILLPSMNNSQKYAVVKKIDSHQGETEMLRLGDSTEKKRKVVMKEKTSSTPASGILPKRKELESNQSEDPLAGSSETIVGSLRSKMFRRKSQGEKL